MNKLFDENKISTFRDREIIIGIDERVIDELRNYVYKAEMYDEKDKEIERLTNIIDELEKYINKTKLEEFEKHYGRKYGKTFTQAEVIICNMIINKLQELKGSNKE